MPAGRSHANACAVFVFFVIAAVLATLNHTRFDLRFLKFVYTVGARAC